ncbi:AraC family transcriptional regulator [Chryseobacterium sp. BIGb0232]|uniref:helix-turn-helix domain-containing protein n=1 Tax=Chryseobacterium sp. BIGb0232 TaxID=2940598 RepID=UPI000F9553B1|nr:helix-turn-helix domain-containing protein [Chryseobacterium sp. BIGb0232]MCS4304023.1 AraC-like DNA-binding protein [Chryseobacterium sp. BIGb0232]ROS17606.1 helix-turn-helix protein [Chryseobacterium nakagawai]
MAFINDIGKIIFFLFLLLSFFLITAKSERKLPHYLFAAFLLVSVIDLSGFFLPAPHNRIIQGLKVSSILLQMPLYYLYVNSACYYNFKLQRKHLLHGLPFIFFSCLFSISGISEQADQMFDIVSTLQYYCYIIAVFWVLRFFRKVYQENYSDNHHFTYKWLFQTTVIFLIGNIFVLLRGFLKDNNTVFIGLYTFSSVFVLFVISWLVLNALYRPSLFAGIDKNLTPVKPVKEIKEEPEQLKILISFMKTEKPYRDDKLTLQKLAEQMNMSEKQLSQLINQHTGKHFFDFTNEFRINDAKVLLKENLQLTVLEILYEVGFNSKSSFYTAFKKETNQTPTDYRKSVSLSMSGFKSD